MSASVYRLEDYRRFDVGTPVRCYLCGDNQPCQVFGEGGYVWACRRCPHPEDASPNPKGEQQQ